MIHTTVYTWQNVIYLYVQSQVKVQTITVLLLLVVNKLSEIYDSANKNISPVFVRVWIATLLIINLHSANMKGKLILTSCYLQCILSLLVSTGDFPHVLLLLVKVPFIVFLYYGLNVDMSVLLSQLVVFGKNNEQYKYQ